MNRPQVIQALKALISGLGVSVSELVGEQRPPAPRPRGLDNLQRGAKITARAAAQSKGHDMSRFYQLGDERVRAVCYQCDREAVIVLDDGTIFTSGRALEEECG